MMKHVKAQNHPLVASLQKGGSILSEDAGKYITTMGASNILDRTITPASGKTTLSSLNFNFAPESTVSILDACLLLKMDLICTVTGSTAVKLNNLALTSWPLNKIIQNLQVSINNTVLKSENYTWMGVFEKLGKSDEWRKKYGSLFPSQRDGAGASYSDMVYDTNKTPYSPQYKYGNTMVGTSLGNSPFVPKSSCTNDNIQSRASFPYSDSADWAGGAVTSVSRTWTVTEPLIIDILSLPDQLVGLSHIYKLDITINFVPNVANVLLCNPNAVVLDGTVAPGTIEDPFSGATPNNGCYDLVGGHARAATFTVTSANEELHITQMVSSSPLPTSYDLPYNQIIRHFNPSAATDHNAECITQVGTFQFGQVPSALYFVVRPSIQSKPSNMRADAFMPITNISLQIGGHIELSSSTADQLYLKAVRNGLNVDWPSWRYGNSCVVCVRPGVDIGNLSPGVLTQLQIVPTVTWQNNTNIDALVCEVTMFVVNNGSLHFSNTSITPTSGISPNDVRKITNDEMINDNSDPRGVLEATGSGFHGRKYRVGDYSAGSFSSFMSGLWNDALKPALGAVLPIASQAAMRRLGAGESAGDVSGGKYLVAGESGGATHHHRSKYLK